VVVPGSFGLIETHSRPLWTIARLLHANAVRFMRLCWWFVRDTDGCIPSIASIAGFRAVRAVRFEQGIRHLNVRDVSASSAGPLHISCTYCTKLAHDERHHRLLIGDALPPIPSFVVYLREREWHGFGRISSELTGTGRSLRDRRDETPRL